MKYKIYYTSSRGVAEAIAYAISDAVGVSPERLNPAFMPDNVDLMFLGHDGSHADDVVMDFIAQLGPARVRRAVLFNTNSTLTPRAIERMRAALRERRIPVEDLSFLCQSTPFKKDLSPLNRDAVVHFAHAALRNAGFNQEKK